jgi:ribonuclease Y
MEIIIWLLGGAVLGAGAGFGIHTLLTRKKGESIIAEARKEAEAIKKEKMLQAKEKFIELKAEHERHVRNEERKLTENEKRLKEREIKVSQAFEENKRRERDLDKQKGYLERQTEVVDKKKPRPVWPTCCAMKPAPVLLSSFKKPWKKPSSPPPTKPKKWSSKPFSA